MIASVHKDTEILDPVLCSGLLERIEASAELKRAARLREFLRYVGQRWLEQRSVSISEQEIGIHVFGRPENYDTSHDNIVRVNASELRRRIEAYFASEGSGETLLLEIPRGSYTPVFRLRAQDPTLPQIETPPSPAIPELSAAQPMQTEAAIRRPLNLQLLFFLVPFLFVLAACLWLLKRDSETQKALYAWKREPALGQFWSGFIYPHRQTDIVLADTSFALIEDVLKKQISLSEYLNHDYIQQIQSSNLSTDVKTDLETIATRSNGSFGDFQVAQKVLALDPLSTQLRLRFARDYLPEEIRNDNVILIGSSRSNPWVSLFEDRLNFTLALDPALNGTLVIKNKKPLPGEQPVYTSFLEDSSISTGYSLVDYIPNQNHTTDVLIMAGTTSAATEAAGDFLTSEELLQKFQNKLHVRKLPYFEVLLKTTRLAGTPLSAEVVAYRTY